MVAWADNALCLKSGGAAERRSAIHASYLNHNADDNNELPAGKQQRASEQAIAMCTLAAFRPRA